MSTKKDTFVWLEEEGGPIQSGLRGVVLCITQHPSLSLLERVPSGCLPGYNPHISPGLPRQCQQKPSGCDQRAPGLRQWPDLREWAEPVLVRGCGG